jgi:hypothetical protein
MLEYRAYEIDRDGRIAAAAKVVACASDAHTWISTYGVIGSQRASQRTIGCAGMRRVSVPSGMG